MVNKWIEKNITKWRSYYRSWYALNGRNRSQNYVKVTVDWQRANPEKVRARNAVNDALRKGLLTKLKMCADCSQERRLSGHHTDYNKVLDVIWLCSSCHKLRHPINIDSNHQKPYSK